MSYMHEVVAAAKPLLAGGLHWCFIFKPPVREPHIVDLHLRVGAICGCQITRVVSIPPSRCLFICRSDTTKNKALRFPELTLMFIEKQLLPPSALNDALTATGFRALTENETILCMLSDADAAGDLPANVLGLLKTWLSDDMTLETEPLHLN